MLILFIYKLQMFGILFLELDSVDLKFPDVCLVKWGRFPSAAAENAWGNFQRYAWWTLKKLAEKHSFQEVMRFTCAWRCFNVL